jgi:hypothetical protein
MVRSLFTNHQGIRLELTISVQPACSLQATRLLIRDNRQGQTTLEGQASPRQGYQSHHLSCHTAFIIPCASPKYLTQANFPGKGVYRPPFKLAGWNRIDMGVQHQTGFLPRIAELCQQVWLVYLLVKDPIVHANLLQFLGNHLDSIPAISGRVITALLDQSLQERNHLCSLNQTQNFLL